VLPVVACCYALCCSSCCDFLRLSLRLTPQVQHLLFNGDNAGGHSAEQVCVRPLCLPALTYVPPLPGPVCRRGPQRGCWPAACACRAALCTPHSAAQVNARHALLRAQFPNAQVAGASWNAYIEAIVADGSAAVYVYGSLL